MLDFLLYIFFCILTVLAILVFGIILIGAVFLLISDIYTRIMRAKDDN